MGRVRPSLDPQSEFPLTAGRRFAAVTERERKGLGLTATRKALYINNRLVSYLLKAL